MDVETQSERIELELDEVVSLHRQTLAALHTADPERESSLDNQAGVLHTRFQKLGHLPDLDEAVGLYRKVLRLRPAHGADRSRSLNNLATVLHARFKETCHRPDLDEAISLHEESVVLQPAPHSGRALSLSNLAMVLRTLFEQTAKLSDLDRVISLHRETLILRPDPHPDRLSLLSSLAMALHSHFEQAGQLTRLEEAVSVLREALNLQPAPHTDRSSLFHNLATILHTRSEETGHLTDLDEAILLHREGLHLRPAPHADRSLSLNNLAAGLLTRYKTTGQCPDLDEAILLHEEALLHPAPHPDRALSLSNIASTLHTRFEQTAKLPDLDRAIYLHRAALALRPAPHLDRPYSLNNLATALQTRFDQMGQLTDLDEAVLLLRETLVLQSRHSPNRARSLSNLGTALHARFKETGQHLDLDEAVELHRQALILRPAPHPDRPSLLSNLAIAIETRSEQTQTLQHADLDDAISLHHEALDLLPISNPLRLPAIHNLAMALHARFSKTSLLRDLDEAISRHREALALRQPAPHPDRWCSLKNLAVCLGARFIRSHEIPEVDEAITFCHEALEVLPVDHPGTFFVWDTLGHRFLDRFLWLGQLDDMIEEQPSDLIRSIAGDIRRASDAFRTAAQCQSAPLSSRLITTRNWAMTSYDSCSSPESLQGSDPEAHETAMRLLSRLAMLGLDLKSRQDTLASTDGYARDAAACAIQQQDFKKAIEYIEEGRAIFWSQALQLRTPLDDLEAVAPELAQKLKDISCALEGGNLRDVSRSTVDHPEKGMSVEKEANHYRQLNVEWLDIVKEVQELDGFQDFLGTKSFTTLSAAAMHGPVVILNVSEFTGCDALVMEDSQDPVHIPLPQFGDETVEEFVQMIRTLPRTSVPRDRGDRHLSDFQPEDEGVEDPEEILREILQTLWRSVVQPVFHYLKLEKSKSPPRLWWLPTGPFASLPIHAAGIYDAGDDSECVSDYVVSSYTPTLSTLLAPPPVATDPFSMLAVIQPVTKGQTPLPQTRAELRKIEERVSKNCLVKLGIPEAPAYVKDVLTDLPNASVVHFACHGIQDAKNALDSALLLEDGRLKVSQLMQLSLPNASLVFLSACQTAVASKDLPDEPIHLAAAMLFAGFCGAVATMWSIDDRDGPEITDRFYGHLFSTSATIENPSASPDTTLAARALHRAVAELRSENCSFMRWVPFIHLGL